jgi:hypothetical protein
VSPELKPRTSRPVSTLVMSTNLGGMGAKKATARKVLQGIASQSVGRKRELPNARIRRAAPTLLIRRPTERLTIRIPPPLFDAAATKSVSKGAIPTSHKPILAAANRVRLESQFRHPAPQYPMIVSSKTHVLNYTKPRLPDVFSLSPTRAPTVRTPRRPQVTSV